MKRLFISFPTEFRGMTVLLMEAGGSIRLFVYPHVLRLFHGMAELILSQWPVSCVVCCADGGLLDFCPLPAGKY